MSLEGPLVSVIMPAYNSGEYIARSIQSIVEQTYEHWELIVINDGSTDNTAEIIEQFSSADTRIVQVNNNQNQGLVAGRNQGLSLAKGKYIANLDSDDVALPQRLNKQVTFLEANSNVVLLGSACTQIDKKGNKLTGIKRNIPDHHLSTLLLFSNYFINSTTMFRRELTKSITYSSDIPLAEDYNFFVELSQLGGISNLSDYLVEYRVHDSNISTIKEKELKKSMKEIYKKQLERLGINPSQEELEVHASLVEEKVPRYEGVEVWLQKIVDANKEYKVYDFGVLGYYCAFFYRRYCLNKYKGLEGVKFFRKSPLFQFIKRDLRGNSIFFAKSFLK